jgi:hypothetical protein
VRHPSEAHIAKPKFPANFVYHIINIKDAPGENIMSFFTSATAFIFDAWIAGGVVLIHDGDGGLSVLLV